MKKLLAALIISLAALLAMWGCVDGSPTEQPPQPVLMTIGTFYRYGIGLNYQQMNWAIWLGALGARLPTIDANGVGRIDGYIVSSSASGRTGLNGKQDIVGTNIAGFRPTPGYPVDGVYYIPANGAYCANSNNGGFPRPWSFIGQEMDFECSSVTVGATVNPTPLNLLSNPSSLTLSGTGLFSNTGTPLVRVYDAWGNLVAEVSASSYATNGSSLTIPVNSDLQALYNGSYAAVIYSLQSDGSYLPSNAGALDIVGHLAPPTYEEPIPDLPGGRIVVNN